MATTLSHDAPTLDSDLGIGAQLRSVLMPLSSLRLTVALFAVSMVLVFAGTLAQVDHDVNYVVARYFRCWFTWIELQVFFPRNLTVPGALPYPGGWFLGALLTVNLIAAHLVRFRVAAKGPRLAWGTALVALGCGLTYLVIRSGMDNTIESELSAVFCDRLWHALRAGLGTAVIMLGYLLALAAPKMRRTQGAWLWWLGVVAVLLLAGLTLWLFTHPETRLDASGLRILWQLIKAGAAGVVLLAGCIMVFGHRAGVVLLHGGIGLMMLSEVLTGLHAQEAHMQLVEGKPVAYAEDNTKVELALTVHGERHNTVTAVPGWMLRSAAGGEPISRPGLPVDLRVVEYLPNAAVRLQQPGESGLATVGPGLLSTTRQLRTFTGGADDDGTNFPAAYVELLEKGSGRSLGTVLVSPLIDMQSEPLQQAVEADGKPFEVALRFKRIPKDYSVTLLKFERTTYVGTETAKSFRSVVRVQDPESNVDLTVPIWMNNPLRYAGDTLYQSGFDPEKSNFTILQVVSNANWMIPYVGCMIVGTGMVFHFGRALLLFSQRKKADTQQDEEAQFSWISPTVLVPAALVGVMAIYAVGHARTPEPVPGEPHLADFGRLPVAYQGRVKPIDTLARNALLVLSGKQTYADARFDGKQPAVRWLLEWISGSAAALDHRVVRIEDLEILQTLGLEPRSGFRYSVREVLEPEETLDKQVRLAREVPPKRRSKLQKGFATLGDKLTLMNVFRAAFTAAKVGSGSSQEVLMAVQDIEGLNSLSPPLVVPPEEPNAPWRTLMHADLLDRLQESDDLAVRGILSMLTAHADGDAEGFNEALAAYQAVVAERAAADAEFDSRLAASGKQSNRKVTDKLIPSRLDFEAFFNRYSPFKLAMVLYILAFLLALASWVGWPITLRRSANWLLWLTFVIHTLGLIARIYISGRPPVTNLYSSAVFVGWAGVLLALVFEQVYRFGVGNLLAAVLGLPTLIVAQNLAGDGDTFKVLQAVLDTQFWLATHVVTIALGYSATLAATALGVISVLAVHVGGLHENKIEHKLYRITYATVCFGLLLSFVGTVLGGLWADDSWGRFWGWDPKENGALLIVIWNALVLHARWGGMVRARGFALLAIFGGVVTCWSWFGVNFLSVGLHSYGFSSGAVSALVLFVLALMATIGLGLVMNRHQEI